MTYSGFVNEEDESTLDEVPTILCEATATSEAGTYDIVVSGGSDNNYEFSYTNGILTITPSTGIGDLSIANVSVYPNPTSDVIKISMEEITGNTTYRLFTITGRLILVEAIEGDITTVDMSHLESGIYLLQLQEGDKVMNYKIIKE